MCRKERYVRDSVEEDAVTYRRSKGERRFADNFHRNKRHTFHFPDKENYVEDLNFSKKLSSSKNNSKSNNNIHDSSQFFDNTQTSFLHIDKEIPMQSASLEAQKFKTIIFLSGQ